MAGKKLASVQYVHDVAPIEKPGARKTLVVGDLHCKMSLVLPRVTDTALSHCCDSVVLLGDLCDDWGVDGRAMVRQLEYAVEWKAKAEALKLQVTGLMGNHDAAYLGFASYGFTNEDVRDEVAALLSDGLDVRMAAVVSGRLATHAGLTGAWAHNAGIEEDTTVEDVAAQLDDLYADRAHWRSLISCGPARHGWGLPGPLWADRRELLCDPFPGLSQIVGHTPIETAQSYEAESGENFWFLDTMSLYRSGRPIGDATALVMGPDGAEVVPLFEDWGSAVMDFCER